MSLFSQVYDLTDFLKANRGWVWTSNFDTIIKCIHYIALNYSHLLLGALAQPIIEMAGRDLSHWFDRDSRDVFYLFVFKYSHMYECRFEALVLSH